MPKHTNRQIRVRQPDRVGGAPVGPRDRTIITLGSPGKPRAQVAIVVGSSLKAEERRAILAIVSLAIYEGSEAGAAREASLALVSS